MTLGLAIVGYGKMGRLIEQLAPEYGFGVRARFDSKNNARGGGLTREALRGVDVAVEFSTPETAAQNIQQLAAAGVNAAVGTTGWLDHLPAARQAVTQSGTGLVWAPNFSVGVNLFLQAVAYTAALFAGQQEYDAWGWEIHHAAQIGGRNARRRLPPLDHFKCESRWCASGYTRNRFRLNCRHHYAAAHRAQP